MTLRQQIYEERGRFISFYGRDPNSVFLGTKQMKQIDEMVEELRQMGLLVKENIPLARPRIDGMYIYRVDADNHISFGLDQPSPCG